VIVNSYAVLDAFVSLLRLGLGLLIFSTALVAWKSWRRSRTDPETRKSLEDRCYLLFLMSGLLVALNVLAWPIFYLLLQSYVSEWPGVMCIYGVTRVGAGSLGSSRFLPPLLATLQTTKPLLVFLSGAWFVLYLVDRLTRTAPLTGRVLLLLLAASFLAGADAAAELAYLVIPKKEEFLSRGCCTAVLDPESDPARFVPKPLLGDNAGTWLYVTYYAVNAGLVLALEVCARLCRRRLPTGWLAPLFFVALLSLAVNMVFLIEEAAPRLLHLPNHHCPYDLVGRAPHSLAAVALFVGGSFFVGWGCVVGWLGTSRESRPFVAGVIGTLFRLASFGYVCSVLVLSVELALVRGAPGSFISTPSGMASGSMVRNYPPSILDSGEDEDACPGPFSLIN
jgi:hypothetical protein